CEALPGPTRRRVRRRSWTGSRRSGCRTTTASSDSAAPVTTRPAGARSRVARCAGPGGGGAPRGLARGGGGGRPPRARCPGERRFLLSALQSELFNRVLAMRIGDGTHLTALAGDVMQKVESGGIFLCEDPAADAPRIERWEIVPTGPMFGPHMRAPAPGSRP